MNTVRRFIVILVGVATTSLLGAGAASAKPQPLEPAPSPSTVVSHGTSVPPLASRIERMTRADAARAARAAGGAAGARAARSPVKAPSTRSVPQPTTPHPGGDPGLVVLVLTAAVGLGVGVAGTAVTGRVRHHGRSLPA